MIIEQHPTTAVHRLEAHRTLERLIKAGRTPIFSSSLVGKPGDQRYLYFCYIPPVGAEPSDAIRWKHDPALRIMEFVSASQEPRGEAERHVVTVEQYGRLQRQTQDIEERLMRRSVTNR